MGCKVEVLKKKSATLAIPADLCARMVNLGLIPGGLQSFSKLELSRKSLPLWPLQPKCVQVR